MPWAPITGFTPFTVNTALFVGQFFIKPFTQSVRKMDIPGSGCFSVQVVAELVLKQVGL